MAGLLSNNSNLLKRIIFLILSFYLFAPVCRANNLQIGQLEAAGNGHLRFSISWDNSWAVEGTESPYNHDAVWVFVKYRSKGGNWQHLDLSVDSAEYMAGPGLHIETVPDGKGIFLSRKDKGSGSTSPSLVSLRFAGWLPDGQYEFRVYGIEMVKVEEDAFYLGDGAGQEAFRRGDKNAPFLINSENEIALGHDSLSLNDTGKYAPPANIPSAYPKGYHAFYCMKYEISQEQYADFLNSLSFSQQKNHTAVSPASVAGTFAMSPGYYNRNGIVISSWGTDNGQPAVYSCNAATDNVFNNTDDGQNRACNFLTWADITAYLDWAALRPMTELEFEKICRGPEQAVAKEFAWGTDKVTDANTLVNDGTANESVSEVPPAGYGLASHGYDGPQGPLRDGFAANASSNRLRAGAAYYGTMEMSGNLWESCVTVNSQGLLFDGRCGDGELNADGFADVLNWPGKDGLGSGFRGGAWNSGIVGAFRDLAISDRFYAGLVLPDRRNTTGGRGVR
jgi:formylglycine-generating enzyme required for sulfatase activity